MSGHLSIQVKDVKSTLDAIVAYIVLFSMLFASSFVVLPSVGLVEVYQNSLLRAAIVTALALGVVFCYARFRANEALHVGLLNAKESVLTALLGLGVWLLVWVVFGRLTGTYGFVLEPTRLLLVPLAFCVGLLDGLIVYAYSAERFVAGIGTTLGIFLSSLFGWLLFLAVSVDFAFYVLPAVLMLTYVGVKTKSPVGPTVVMGLLMAFFYIYFAVSPWMVGSRQIGYLLMTAISAVSAFVAGLVLTRFSLGGGLYGRDSAA